MWPLHPCPQLSRTDQEPVEQFIDDAEVQSSPEGAQWTAYTQFAPAIVYLGQSSDGHDTYEILRACKVDHLSHCSSIQHHDTIMLGNHRMISYVAATQELQLNNDDNVNLWDEQNALSFENIQNIFMKGHKLGQHLAGVRLTTQHYTLLGIIEHGLQLMDNDPDNKE